jgi:hypothetical protein
MQRKERAGAGGGNGGRGGDGGSGGGGGGRVCRCVGVQVCGCVGAAKKKKGGGGIRARARANGALRNGGCMHNAKQRLNVTTVSLACVPCVVVC